MDDRAATVKERNAGTNRKMSGVSTSALSENASARFDLQRTIQNWNTAVAQTFLPVMHSMV